MDKALRQEGVSWWKEEMPSDAEYDEAIHNLEINDYTVDYIFTHTCSATILNTIPEHRLYSGVAEADPLNDFFDSLEEKVAYKHWFFGHFHYTERLDEKHTVIYQNIKKIYDKWGIL